MRRGRMLGLLFGVAVLLAGALVVAQPGGGGGGPGGRGGGPGGRMGGFPLGGTVVSADIANGVIEVDAGGGRQMQVYPVQATRLLKKEKAEAKDLQVGDSVNANGAPVKIAVRGLTVDKSTPPPAPPADQPAAPGRQAMMMMMGRGGGTVAMASGKVTSTTPLKLQTTTPAPDGSQAQREVELEVPADADVSRIVDGAWEEVVKGATFTAQIHMDDQQRMVLDTMTLGDTMPAGFGGGPGGPGGRGGGRGGRGGGGAGGAGGGGGGGGGAGAPGGGPF